MRSVDEQSAAVAANPPSKTSPASKYGPMAAFMSQFPTEISKTRQHRCSYCPQTFARAEHLIRHERSHRGEKPFQCPFCTVHFIRKDLIKRHIRKQHPQEAESPRGVSISHRKEPRGLRCQASADKRSPTGPSSSEFASNGFLNNQDDDQNIINSSSSSNTNTNNIGNGNAVSMTDSVIAVNNPPLSPGCLSLDYVHASNPEPVTPNIVELQNLFAHPSPNAGFLFRNTFDFDDFFSTLEYRNCTLDFEATGVTSGMAMELNSQPTKSLSAMDLDWNIALDEDTSNPSRNASSTLRSSCRGSFEISELKRIALMSEMQRCGNAISTFPSCLYFERYIAACFDSLFSLSPFIHIPTWQAEEAHTCLLLAIAALGAKYCDKHELSRAFYKAARSSTLREIRFTEEGAKEQPVWLMQALCLTMTYDTWSGQITRFRNSLALQSLLTEMFRARGVADNESYLSIVLDPQTSWEAWAVAETAIRTKYMIYQYFSLVTLAFNHPPAIYNGEVDLPMPCSEQEWNATSPDQWNHFQRGGQRQRLTFFASFQSLLDPSVSSATLGGSSFGKQLMLHALLQQMWFFWQCSSPNSASQSPSLIKALDKWEAAAQLASETSITPYHPRALLDYSSHALHRLARLYTCVDMLKIHTIIATHHQQNISRSIATQLVITRSAFRAQAAMHAMRALRIPLKFGVTRNNACASLQYFIFSFDCSIYLARWIDVVQQAPPQEWSEEEKQVLLLAKSTVDELELPADQLSRPLGAQVAYACAMILKDFTTWDLFTMLLRALTEYADHIAL